MKVGSGLIALALGLASASDAEPIWIGRFDAGVTTIPAPWELRHINKRAPPTQYEVRSWDGVAAVEARADRSMAMLARPVSINLAATPVLCWRWRVDAPVANADMQRKSGDDYAARIYVTFRLPDGGLSMLTRIKLRLARRLFGDAVPDAALNYVWDNLQPVGTELPSSYTDRVQMVVLRSGPGDSGSWRGERRNVLDDFARLFGAVEPVIDSVALGSDADNTAGLAHAGFAELHFVAPDESCASPETR